MSGYPRCVRAWLLRQVAQRPITSLALSWLATRMVVVVEVIAFRENVIGDVRLYSLWSVLLSNGRFPVGDPFWQYPPGAGAVFVAARLIGPDPVSGFVLLALVTDAAILVMLIASCRARSGPWFGPWTWVIGGLAIGPVLLARFDLFPAALAVAAILLVRHPGASGVAAGLGALLKVWPILMIACVPRRHLPRALMAAVIVVGIGLLAAQAWAPGSASFLGEQGARGLQVESVGALPYLLAGAVGFEQDIVLRYGAFEVVMPGVELVGVSISVAGVALIASIGGLRLLGRLEATPAGDVAVALVLLSVATSRVLSPQYAVWIVAVAAAAACDVNSRLRRPTLLLLAMAAVTQVVYPWAYGSLLETAAYAVVLQVVRVSLLLVATAVTVVAVIAPTRDRQAALP